MKTAVARQAFHAANLAARTAITQSTSNHIQQRYCDAAGNAATTWRVMRDMRVTTHPLRGRSVQTLGASFQLVFPSDAARYLAVDYI
jgi:hypothetical protein